MNLYYLRHVNKLFWALLLLEDSFSYGEILDKMFMPFQDYGRDT